MGLLDNSLQRDSTKVVTVSNSSNSEATLGRFPMENDHRDAQGGRPKYKRRSVSALRDFPPGCGQHVPRVSLGKDEEACCVSTVKNSSDLMRKNDEDGDCLVSGSGMDSQPPNILENMGSITIHAPLNHAESKVEDQLIQPGNGINSQPAKTSEDLAATVIPRQSDGFEVKAQVVVSVNGNPVDIEPVKVPFPGVPYSSSNAGDVENEKNDVPTISPNKDVPSSRDRIFPPNYPPRRKVSAVRDFPPFCGRNAAPLIRENSLGQELMHSEDTQNGDAHKLQLDTNACTLIEPDVRPDSEVITTKGRRYEDKTGSYSKNDMEMIMPELLEETGKSHQERVQIQRELKKARKPNELTGSTSGTKQTNDFTSQERHKSFAKAKKTVSENYKRVGMKEKKKKMWNSSSGGQDHNLQSPSRSQNVDVTLPPSLGRSSAKSDGNDASVTRNKVRETLRLFQAVYRKIVKEDEKSKNIKRPDYAAARILKEKGKYLNLNKIIGPVPGVEVGDEFQYRAELNIIGVHRPIQGGIDFVKEKGLVIATSVVASGGYDDNTDDSDVLIYTGSGGNVMDGKKEPEDQKLERGNLALKNSVDAKNPVRVIRGDMRGATELSNSRKMTYVYDGLYVVEKCWQELGPHSKLIYKFKLVRLPGQPELAWKVVKKCKKFKVREGLCVADISKGKEVTPICVVNTIDNQKPPPFEYITWVIYPKGFQPVPSRGCNCTGGCSESVQCSCVVKNGGEIPYNRNGAIVEAKTLVYECGPHCKCPPSCYNRVSQHGIRFQLEIFKTESRGWGVRSLNSISSGSFICEYIGELLEDKEAEERMGNDEYLFDIGNNSRDNSLWDGLSNLISDTHQSSRGVVEESGFTIDAAKYGNVGRFINHSCSPNLYAQNVVYDHDDKRVPHIMFFAAENIPPLQELTYHYNYMIDQVIDSDGSIKKKICYCGSSECTGRLY